MAQGIYALGPDGSRRRVDQDDLRVEADSGAGKRTTVMGHVRDLGQGRTCVRTYAIGDTGNTVSVVRSLLGLCRSSRRSASIQSRGCHGFHGSLLATAPTCISALRRAQQRGLRGAHRFTVLGDDEEA